MLRTDRIHAHAPRVSTAALSWLIAVVVALVGAGCALSPIGSEVLRAPADGDEEDAGDGADDEDDDAPAPRDGGPRPAPRDAGAKDAGTRDAGAPAPAADAGARDAGAPSGAADAGPRDAGTPTARDAGAQDSGRPIVDSGGDPGGNDAGLVPRVLQCQSNAQCVPETCPAFGSIACCKSDGVCGCRPVLGVCR